MHLLLSESTPHSLSTEQHVCTATSHPVPHVLFVSSSFPHKHTHISSPAYLAALIMSLTFGSAVSEVQSIVLPGLTDLCCFVDRIQTHLVLCLQNTAAQALHGSQSSLVKKIQQQQPYSSSLSMKTKNFPILITTMRHKCMHACSSNVKVHTLNIFDKHTEQCNITTLIWNLLLA